MSSEKSAVIMLNELKEQIGVATGFDRVLNHINIIGGDTGHCLAEFVVRKEDLNGYNGLHGGLTATIIDTFTTLALLTTNAKGGLTVNLHVCYPKGAVEGDTIVIDAKVIKVGRTLAFLECELHHKNSGDVVAKGLHTKFVA